MARIVWRVEIEIKDADTPVLELLNNYGVENIQALMVAADKEFEIPGISELMSFCDWEIITRHVELEQGER